MRTIVRRRILSFALVVLFVSLSCGLFGGNKGETPQAEDTPVVVEETSEPVPAGAVTSLDDLEKAVVYIEAGGSYRDPQEGWQVNVGGGGTGFIIDPSGIAVTNNHVVASAANLNVWLAGEDAPRNARVLGVAECSDLAVIDIDGEGFPFLRWYEGDIKAGMDVFTAGFPISGAGIGYTLTKGIISKPKGSVDWAVASVSNIVEHTARINPGNSGGPLVTENAEVVGVNFGFNASLDQNYAVSRDEARQVIEVLRTGQDVDSLGINGVAVDGTLQGNQVQGVWVRSVKSGSPADRTRIQPGDILIQLENQVLDDGTLGGYCSVVRSHSPDDVLSVSVVRADTLEIMEGQINGRELEMVSTLGGGEAQGTGNPNAQNPGEVYFSTEFDDSENWYLLTLPSTEEYRTRLISGKLYLEISPSRTGLYAFYDMDITNPNVYLETYSQKVVGPNTNNISLVCRATGEGWYEFSMTSGGYWYIWLYEKGEGFSLLAKGATTVINMKEAPNVLAASCSENLLTFFINGVEVGSVEDYTFLNGGQVGLSIYSEYPDLGVEFDYFLAAVP